MSTAKNILELFQGLRPGQRLTAVQVSNQGAFDVTQAMVYQALASLCQPGKPLQRARNVHGVYEYELRRDVNLKPLLTGPDIELDTTVPTGEPPAAKKAAAPQDSQPARTEPVERKSVPAATSGYQPASAAAPTPTVKPPETPKPEAPPVTTGRDIPKFLPMDDPNPHRAEVLRFIGDLRIRREAIDEVIRTLESTFGVKP